MNRLFTTDEVATLYRVSRRRVHEIAAARGLMPEFIARNHLLWTANQVLRLKPPQRGGERGAAGRRVKAADGPAA